MQDLSIFYQLPQVSSQPPGITWITDPKLQRYIQKLANSPITSGASAAIDQVAYQLFSTSPNPINNACLTALLAHIALIPARRLRSTHALLQQHYTEDLTDIYQIGLELVSDPRGFLSNFNSNRAIDTGYWYPNLYRWSQQKFDRLLTDRLRNQKGMSGFKRTNLGLVVRATTTKIRKALTVAGYPPATHPTYLALHYSLDLAVSAGRFNTSQPQATDYAEILAIYRQQQVTPLDYEQVIRELDRLGSAVRNYDQLQIQSIDIPLGEDSDRTVLDTIPADQNPLDTAILNEYQQQVDRLSNIVSQLLQQLTIEPDRLLLLLYGLDLTQKDAGKELNCNQTTVMRRGERVLATLAQNIYQQTNQKASNLSSERLNEIVTHSIAFCQKYYTDLLTEIAQQLTKPELQPLIHLVQSRWQIQFQPQGKAISQLAKIINPPSNP
jgi:hypothetical protein